MYRTRIGFFKLDISYLIIIKLVYNFSRNGLDRYTGHCAKLWFVNQIF